MPELTGQTADFISSGSIATREPDTSLNDDITLITELQEAFPKYKGINAYALKKKLINDQSLFDEVSEQYFDFALTQQERQAFGEDPEMRTEVFNQFKGNIKKELYDTSYTGHTIRETLVDRTSQMGVDLDTFPVEEYKGFLEDDKYQGISPDILKQELKSNPELHRQLVEDRYDQFEQELRKQHNPTSTIKDDPTKIAQAWITFDRFGSEGLTQFVNMEQFRGRQVDDVTGAFQQLRDAQEFFSNATVAGKNVNQHMNEFVVGSEITEVPFKDQINDAAYKYGIAPSLLASVIRQESSFKPDARGAKGEIGLGQIMPATAAEMGYSEQDLLDPETNIEASAQYLSERLKQFNHDSTLALSAYNWGQGNVSRAVEQFGQNWHTQMPDSTRNYIQRVNEFQAGYDTEMDEVMVHEPIRERDDIALNIPDDMNRYMGEWFEGRGKDFYRKDDFVIAKSFVENYFPEEFRTPEEVEKLRRDGADADNFNKVAYTVYEQAIHNNGFEMDDLLRSLMAVGDHRQREDGRDEWVIYEDALDIPRKLAFEALSFSSEYNNMINRGRAGTYSIVPDRREASIERWESWKEKLFMTDTIVEDGEFIEKPSSGIIPTLWNSVAMTGTAALDTINRYFLEPSARATNSAMEAVGFETDNAQHHLDKWHENTLGASVSDISSWDEDGYIVGSIGGVAPFVQYIGAMIAGGQGIVRGGAKAMQYMTRGKTLEDTIRAGAFLKDTKYARASTNLAQGMQTKAPWMQGVGIYYTGGAAIEASQPQEVSFYKIIPEMIGMEPTNDITRLYDQASTAGKVGLDMLGSVAMDTFFDHAIGAAVFGAAKGGQLRGKTDFKSINWNSQKNGGMYEIVDSPQFKTDLRRFWGNLLGPIRELPDGLDYGITQNIANKQATTMKGLARGFADDANFVMGDVKQEIRHYLDHVNKEFGDGELLSQAQVTQIVDEQYNVFLDSVANQMGTYLRAGDETGDTILRFSDSLEGLQPTLREYTNPDFSPVTPSDVGRLRAEGRNVVELGGKVYDVDERYWTTELSQRLRDRAFRQNADETVERRLREEGLEGKERLTEADLRRVEEIEADVRAVVGTPVRVGERMGYVVDMQDGEYIVRTDTGEFVRQTELSSGVNFDRLELLDGQRRFQRAWDHPNQAIPDEPLMLGAGTPPETLSGQQAFEAQQAGIRSQYPEVLDPASQNIRPTQPRGLLAEPSQPHTFQRMTNEESRRLADIREINEELTQLQRQYDNAELAVANRPLSEYSPARQKELRKEMGQLRRQLTKEMNDVRARQREAQTDLSQYLMDNPDAQGIRGIVQDMVNNAASFNRRNGVFTKNLQKARETAGMVSKLQQRVFRTPFC